MNYILKSRGRGKTYDLIARSAKTGDRIICANKNMAMFINLKAQDMKFEIPEAMSFDEYLKYHNGIPKENIMIDELKMFLNNILNCNVTVVSDTPTEIIMDVNDIKN